MRLLPSILLLFSVMLAGCGRSSELQTPELSEIEAFVDANADDLARQEEMMNEIGDDDDSDDPFAKPVHRDSQPPDTVVGASSPFGLWGALGTRTSGETIEEQLNQ